MLHLVVILTAGVVLEDVIDPSGVDREHGLYPVVERRLVEVARCYLIELLLKRLRPRLDPPCLNDSIRVSWRKRTL